MNYSANKNLNKENSRNDNYAMMLILQQKQKMRTCGQGGRGVKTVQNLRASFIDGPSLTIC